MGLSLAAFNALDVDERAARVATARAALEEAGAHMVIDTVADLPEALAKLPIG